VKAAIFLFVGGDARAKKKKAELPAFFHWGGAMVS